MSGWHVTLDLADQLVELASRLVWAAYREQHGAALPGRRVDASVSGGSRSDPTGGRALYGTSDEDVADRRRADGSWAPRSDEFGAVGGNRALSFAAPKLRKAIDQATRALDVLEPQPGRDREGQETGRKSCRVCGCCRAVNPKARDKTATRCDGCYQFRRRWGRDRNADEIGEHQERMWAEEQDRRTRGTG